MSKFRIILFSCLGCLGIVTAVSMAGVLPNRFFKWHKERQEPSSETWEEKDLFTEEGPTVNQVVNNLYSPHYDEFGRETFVLRGKKAILLNDKTYKIDSPEIYLRRDVGSPPESTEIEPPEAETEARSSKDIIVTSRMGELDKDTNEGLLTGGVMVEFGQGATIKTDHLRYNPKESKATTGDPVLFQGDKMKIRGEGLGVELATGRMWIEKEVVAELSGVRGNLMLSSFGGASGSQRSEAKTIIRCDGRLVYEKETNMLTFHDKVRVRQGVSTLLTDKLVLVFDEKGQRTKLLIADGDVLASDGVRVAKGKSLFWDAITDATTLEDTPSAEFLEERFTLIAPKIIFSQGGRKAEAPVGGQLNAKGSPKAKAKDATIQSWEGVNIIWKGKMTFQKDIEQATFEEDVHLTKRDSSIYCQRMIINFEGEEMKVKTMEAFENVYIVERKKGMLREATGQEGTWDFPKDVAELRGEGTLFLQTKPEETREQGLRVKWDQKMMVQDNKQKITFHENVRAVKEFQRVDCNQLNTFMGENNQLEKVVALGDVFYVDAREGGIESTGDMMEWDCKTDKVVVTGEPTAEARRKKSRTFAKKIYYDVKTKQVGWKERTHWEIPDERRDTTTPLTLNQMLSKP
jgi:LPS export ABC transporter protein LptC/lipopolysaccharide transport protein LptA